MDIITGRMAMRKVFGLICFFGLMSGAVSAHDEVRLISVTGNVEKSFQPDIVRLNITVWGKGDSAKKAQANNQTNYELMKKSVETYKIKKEDIRTTSYELNPEYVYDQKNNKNNISGYTANQGLTITMRKIEDAGPFIDSMMTASKALTGGVNIVSLGFDLDKRQEAERDLLVDAVKAAQEQAEVLAKAAKVKLKGIYRLSPRGTVSPVMMQADMMTMRAKSAGATQLMSGEVKVEGSVSADYLIE